MARIGWRAAYLIFYSAWWGWTQEMVMGPRYMIAGLPGLMALNRVP